MTTNELNEMITDDIEESLLTMIDGMLEEYTNPDFIFLTERFFFRHLITNYNHIRHFASIHNIKMQEVKIVEDKEMIYNNIIFYLRETHTLLEMIVLEKYSNSSNENAQVYFGSTNYYKITEDNLNLLQQTINELRELINSNETLTESHKRRILKRLNELQSELDTSMSSIDKFWLFLGEANSTFHSFGENSKLFLEKAKIIYDILQSAHQIAFGLPPLPNVNLSIEFNNTSEKNKNLPEKSDKSIGGKKNTEQKSE